MKRIICALMVVVWLATIVGGCQSEPGTKASRSNDGANVSADFDTQIGKINAYGQTLDSSRNRANIHLGVTWEGESTIDSCVFSIGRYQQGDQKGLLATVRSTTGDLLWQYTLAVQKGPQTTFILTEKSHDDSLTVMVTEGTTERTETYLRAGAAPLVLSYPIGLVDRTIQKLELSSEELKQVKALMSAYQGWTNSNSTLNNNRYASLINALKNESEFAAYLGPAAMAKATTDCPECDDVCYWAETCALIKCLIPQNPICWACSGVSIGCWLDESWDRITDFFDW